MAGQPTLAVHISLTLRPKSVYSNLAEELLGIVSFTVDGHEADEIRQTLARQHINVTVSHLTSTRLDMEARGLTNVVRASVHYYNNEAEIDRFCATLATLR
jgi:cysteine desulfurase / selenocysteine lyase